MIQHEETKKKEVSEKLTEANERKGKSRSVDAKWRVPQTEELTTVPNAAKR